MGSANRFKREYISLSRRMFFLFVTTFPYLRVGGGRKRTKFYVYENRNLLSYKNIIRSYLLGVPKYENNVFHPNGHVNKQNRRYRSATKPH